MAILALLGFGAIDRLVLLAQFSNVNLLLENENSVFCLLRSAFCLSFNPRFNFIP